MSQDTPRYSPGRPLPALIFSSRWLQLPLDLGLIGAQCVDKIMSDGQRLSAAAKH